MYERHSINKANFVLGIGNWKQLIDNLFSKKSIVMDPVPKGCQHDLLNSLWHPELFYCLRFSVFRLYGPLRQNNVKTICKKVFDIKMLPRTQHTFFSKFHTVCTSRQSEIFRKTSVQAQRSLNCQQLKCPQSIYFCVIKIVFVINQF